MNHDSKSGSEARIGPLDAGLPRRQALRSIGTGVALAGLGSWRLFGQAPGGNAHADLIPPEKGFRPEWVRSLFERGERTVYTKSRDELRFIGMPVGGICCGTVYLGGDGRLWLWDIFNRNQEGVVPKAVDHHGRTVRSRDGAAYVDPNRQTAPLQQGFGIEVVAGGRKAVRSLDESGWPEISFTGEYPIGFVGYRDPALGMRVDLEAFSPFMPLESDDSSLPATFLTFTVTNDGSERAEVRLGGWLENAVGLDTVRPEEAVRRNRVLSLGDLLFLDCSLHGVAKAAGPVRPEIVFEDFEKPAYEDWEVTGTAFGTGPVERGRIPAYQGDVGGRGARVVNSHHTRKGEDVGGGDAHRGRLRSREFRIERRHIAFDIGGGSHAGRTCLNLLVDGRVVRTATGRDSNRMRREYFEVGDLEGKTARIEIVDEESGGWGNVGVDHIVFTDDPPPAPPLRERPDYGTMGLALVGARPGDRGAAALPAGVSPLEGLFEGDGGLESWIETPGRMVGGLVRRMVLEPGARETVTFLVVWHFANLRLDLPDDRYGRHYAVRFPDARAVARYAGGHAARLMEQTRRWHDTWYDSTLPRWFLDRTMANTSTLATTTCHRFGSRRFYAWEGVGCCPGTCTHVWHYAQAVGRLFPEIERDLRERVDFGLGFEPGRGVVQMRAEKHRGPAVDGQCGRILGVYREHQMSADDGFLRRVWPAVKEAVIYLDGHDTDGDGVLDTAQENTLDAAWYGEIPWITSLYLAALRAAESMAREMGDTEFAQRCRKRFETGRHQLETRLYNGEYFIQRADPKRPTAMGTYEACHIDQVFGQGWAWQVALGRVIDRERTVSALRALYRYNFAPDLTRFLARFPKGRPYALAGEAGLLMDTNPRGVPNVFRTEDWQGMYFYECMSGFEHQVASHLIAEGLVLEGLAVTRAIHDRYHARRRNPWNEVECGDHYARAMASYGSFISACGFEHHGPRRHLGFAPRLTPEHFRAAFTAAEGWGTYEQRQVDGRLEARITLRWGRLVLESLALTVPGTWAPSRVEGRLKERPLNFRFAVEEGRVAARLDSPVTIEEHDTLTITVA